MNGFYDDVVTASRLFSTNLLYVVVVVSIAVVLIIF